MTFYEDLGLESFGDLALGTGVGALIALGIGFLVLILLAVYIYHSWAWFTIAKKLKHKKEWVAWIPIANVALILHLGKFHWAWIFLILIPIVGWIALLVLFIIATWRVFEKRNYPGWFSLSSIIPEIGALLYLIAIGFVSWKDKGESTRKVIRKTSKKKKR
jgi:hypothetical protein